MASPSVVARYHFGYMDRKVRIVILHEAGALVGNHTIKKQALHPCNLHIPMFAEYLPDTPV